MSGNVCEGCAECVVAKRRGGEVQYQYTSPCPRAERQRTIDSATFSAGKLVSLVLQRLDAMERQLRGLTDRLEDTQRTLKRRRGRI
jgi:hypothetical protein